MKIILATGGTGGHLFPALKVAEELRKGGHEVLLWGSFTIGLDRIQAQGFVFKNFYARGLVLNSLKGIAVSVWSILRATFCAFCSLRTVRPDVVCGFGGYGAFPIVVSAVFLRIPTMIHEQNVVPGRANKILSKLVRKIALSFEQSKKYFNTQKTIVTGCPTNIYLSHLDKTQVLKKFGLDRNRKTILIFGGSQGAHRINEEALKVVELLVQQNRLVQYIHICGKNDLSIVRKKYDALKVPSALYDFFSPMEEAYTAADVIISRAGAVSVTEMALFGRPAILIPYPHAQGHQRENAMALKETGLAHVIEENDITTGYLAQVIINFLDKRIELTSENIFACKMFFSDSQKRLASEIVRLSQK